MLAELPARGVRSLTVICPGFAVDCLETLEEIALEGREIYLRAGGTQFQYVPALNDRGDHARALAQRVLGAARLSRVRPFSRTQPDHDGHRRLGAVL